MQIEIGRGKRARQAYALDDIAVVPTRRTLPQEIEHASQHASVEPTVRKAVRRILDGGL